MARYLPFAHVQDNCEGIRNRVSRDSFIKISKGGQKHIRRYFFWGGGGAGARTVGSIQF